MDERNKHREERTETDREMGYLGILMAIWMFGVYADLGLSFGGD